MSTAPPEYIRLLWIFAVGCGAANAPATGATPTSDMAPARPVSTTPTPTPASATPTAPSASSAATASATTKTATTGDGGASAASTEADAGAVGPKYDLFNLPPGSCMVDGQCPDPPKTGGRADSRVAVCEDGKCQLAELEDIDCGPTGRATVPAHDCPRGYRCVATKDVRRVGSAHEHRIMRCTK